MPRKGYIPRRESAADPKYDSVLVTRFINAIMTGGKRSIAEGHFYKAMAMAEEKSGQEAMAILKLAMNNVKPVLEVKSRRVGGANYRVPVESVRIAAMRWRHAGSSRSRAAARTTRSRRNSRTS
jgi:small subunit ribosomal protein S7